MANRFEYSNGGYKIYGQSVDENGQPIEVVLINQDSQPEVSGIVIFADEAEALADATARGYVA